ncbi:gliding motility-associated C-terminal domain-containing protein [Flavitalea sp. BT771]|uniref:T9SS type B sorting domain-containing protein n=1 Tax=Flavitalea sp. BT771 TaxID=3063329 RepID=UPI0026E1B014|nr:gliding motility-associated C-terminal domain-containing protein [Flavitalea sp. BT771]MDO6435655.1 gliding motility-associated C-terminal domain-containing protein [Flavitalea sp. BT771]MDV6224556.1 gliding motility-associated C-terminal domain-containing protein [Flavitalea sp. BT771]
MKNLIAGIVLIFLCYPVVAQSSIQVTVSASASTCGSYNSTILVIGTGGTPPYSYSLDGGDWSNSQIFLTGGAATHTVTVRDATGQTTSKPVTINNYYSPPTVRVAASSNPSGCTAQDASVTLQASGGTPPYTYSQDKVNWTANPTFSGLPGGWYYFYVKDYYGCTARVQYSSLPTCGGYSFTNVNASCGQNGEVHIKADPSTINPPITYSLDGVHYQATGDFTGLTPGRYIIRVKDGTGADLLAGSYIIDECPLSIQGAAQDATCGNNNGKITVSASNGTPPYMYTIDGFHYQNSTVFINLAPGNYTAVVLDYNGKMQGAVVTVESDCPRVTAVPTNPTCGNSDGSITATGVSGTAPYTYSRDGVNFQSSPVFAGLAPGGYTITVKDAKNFTATATATVGDGCLHLMGLPQNSTCGKRNGEISAIGAGGTPPYTYSLDGVNYQAGDVFNGLVAGHYTLMMKDVNDQTISTGVTVGNNMPPPLIQVSAMPASCRNNDGSLDIAGSGGTSPFQYSIDGSNYSNNGVFDHLSSGGYMAYVKDVNGCIVNQSSAVVLNNTLTVDAGPVLTICEGESGVIQARSNGSSFSWQPSSGLSKATALQPAASPSITTLYTLTAVDGVCQQTSTVNVIVRPAPVADAGADVITCYGKQASLKGGGGSVFSWKPATYLSDPAVPDPVADAPSGSMTYSLTVKDGNGCQSLNKASVTVTVTPPAGLFVGADTAVLAGQPVPLFAQDVNNSGFTTFTWSPAEGLSNPAIQDPIAILQGGTRTYRVTAVTDAGCSATGSIIIKTFSASDIFVPAAFSPNGDGHNDLLRAVPMGMREFKYFAIFSRWGQRIFYTSDPAAGWDGTIDGRIVEAGTYVWMTGGIDYRGQWIQRKGTVMLIR